MVMHSDPPLDETARQAEARAEELISEFCEHIEECREAHPEQALEKRDIFEGWAIQKIAGLQLCVEHMAEQLNGLARGD